MSDEILERIEKQMEGSNLALAAVADVLNKMDGRLSKADQEEEIVEEQKAADLEKSDLIKSIATEVYDLIKADNGMDVDGTKVRSGKSIAQGGDADDSATTVDATRNIREVQATIQAMQKEEATDEEEDPEASKGYKKADDEEADPAAPIDEDEDQKKAADDDEDDDGEKPTELEHMQKELDSLRKQIAEFEGTMEKAVTDESETRLRKMGFREETGLVAPQLSALGTDGTTPIVKSATDGDTVDQLANLSYGELRELQMRIQAGDTNGVPKELL